MLFKYKEKIYPNYIKQGKAASFIFPFAKHFCKGKGVDIGGLQECSIPNAKIINTIYKDNYSAYNLPNKKYDYIFSSHTLEHLPDYIKALKHWKDHLKKNGVLFLYLPHPDMEYWHPQNNRKHYHLFYPDDIKKTLLDLGFKNVINSDRDLYWAFSVIGFNK